MINFAVINLKNIIKNFIKLGIIITLAIGIMNIGDLVVQKCKKFSYVQILKNNLDFSKLYGNSENKNIFAKIINSEIPLFSSNNKLENSNKLEDFTIAETPITSETNSTENPSEPVAIETNNTENSDVPVNVTTSVITENNLSENYNVTYGSVKIKNETNYYLSDAILEPNVQYSDTKNILIFHTHTCESYTQTEANPYTPSGNFRTIDLNHSVAQVGTTLENNLKNKGYNVTHSLTFHDYPAYNGSYNRSFSTVSNLLTTSPSTQLVIDLHRDAIGSMSQYAPCVKIGDEVVAQIMFVIGTNGGGLEHNNWQTNLKYAIKIQEKANEMYPGLFRPIILRNSRYNQNLANNACIIEVGATGNTLEQATRKYEIFSSSYFRSYEVNLIIYFY